LRLPYLFGDKAGEAVQVELQRDVSGGAPETVTVEIVPEDRPGWTEQPNRAGEPLAIPSIGVAYHMVPRILAVIPGGPAEKAQLKEGDKIEKITLVLPAGAKAEPTSDGKAVEILMVD